MAETIEIQKSHLRIPIYSAIVIAISIAAGVWKMTAAVTQVTEAINRLDKRLANIETLDMKTEITLIKYRLKKIEDSSAMRMSRFLDAKSNNAHSPKN